MVERCCAGPQQIAQVNQRPLLFIASRYPVWCHRQVGENRHDTTAELLVERSLAHRRPGRDRRRRATAPRAASSSLTDRGDPGAQRGLPTPSGRAAARIVAGSRRGAGSPENKAKCRTPDAQARRACRIAVSRRSASRARTQPEDHLSSSPRVPRTNYKNQDYLKVTGARQG